MKEYIESLFTKNIASINAHYQKSDELSIAIIEEIVKSTLEDTLLDSTRLSFVDFSKKYLRTTSFLEFKDFTSTEIKEIIAETPLTERDRRIATLRYLELRSEEDISDILQIDKKTVHTNIPKISFSLKRTALKIHHNR